MTAIYIAFPILLATIDVSVFIGWIGSDYDWVTFWQVIVGIHVLAFLTAALIYFTLWCYGAPIPPLF